MVESTTDDGRPFGRTRQGKIALLPAGSAAAGELCEATVRSASAWQLTADVEAAAA